MPQTSAEWASWVSAVVALIAVIITAYNVYISRGLLIETREIRLSQTEPNVIVRIAPHVRQEQNAYASLIIENLGPGIALQVGLSLIDTNNNFDLPAGGILTDLRPFQEPIAMKPGEKFESLLYIINDVPGGKSNVPKNKVEVELEYYSLNGRKTTSRMKLDNNPWLGQVKIGYTKSSRSGKNEDGTLLDVYNGLQAIREMLERRDL